MCENLLHNLGIELYYTAKLSDITFVVEDDEFHLHKFILAACCPYFEVMLLGNTKESSMKSITLVNTSKKLFETVVKYMYTTEFDEESLDPMELVELIYLTHEYQFSTFFNRLILIVSPLITRGKDVKLVAAVLNFPFIDQFPEMKENCLKYLEDNSNRLIENEDLFALLSKDTVCTIVSRNNFPAKEIDIFKILYKWLEVNGITNENKVVLSNLRLNLISITEFVEVVKPLNIIDTEKYLSARRRYNYCKDVNERRRKCDCHGSRCKSEILKAYVKRENGSTYQFRHAPIQDDLVNVFDKETVVIELTRVTCTINSICIPFVSAFYGFLETFEMKIHNEKGDNVPNTWTADDKCCASFFPQIVDRIEIKYYIRALKGYKIKTPFLQNNLNEVVCDYREFEADNDFRTWGDLFQQRYAKLT